MNNPTFWTIVSLFVFVSLQEKGVIAQSEECKSLVLKFEAALLPSNTEAERNVVIDSYVKNGISKEMRGRKNLPKYSEVTSILRTIESNCNYSVLPELVRIDSLAGAYFRKEFLQSYWDRYDDLSVWQYAIFESMEKRMIPMLMDSLYPDSKAKYEATREQLFSLLPDNTSSEEALGVSWISRRGPIYYMGGKIYIFMDYMRAHINEFSEYLLDDLSAISIIEDRSRGQYYCTKLTRFASKLADKNIESILISNISKYEDLGCVSFLIGALGARGTHQGIKYIIDYTINGFQASMPWVHHLRSNPAARAFGEEYLLNRIDKESDPAYKLEAIKILLYYPSEATASYLLKRYKKAKKGSEECDIYENIFMDRRYFRNELLKSNPDLIDKIDKSLYAKRQD